MGWALTQRSDSPLPGREGGAAEARGGAVEHELGGALWIAHDVAIPEANDLPTQAFEIRRALGIMILLIEMLAAVEFNRELRLAARQIDDVSANNELPRERWPTAR